MSLSEMIAWLSVDPSLTIHRDYRAGSQTMIDMPPIPTRLQLRPRDERGHPLPFTQYIDSKGKPDFRVLDDARVRDVLNNRLCALCGIKMSGDVFFIGGTKCEQYDIFYDPPMHKDRAIFALRTCPHLARAKGRHNLVAAMPSDALIVQGHMPAEKSEWFALMRARRYSGGRDASGMIIVRAKLPWISVERWCDGKPMESGLDSTIEPADRFLRSCEQASH
jgi:hypothetical protein